MENFEEAKKYWVLEKNLVSKLTDAINSNNSDKTKLLRQELKSLKISYLPYQKTINKLSIYALKNKISINEITIEHFK